MHGHPTTIFASVELMALHMQAVARGAPKKFLVGDMPFLSYRQDLTANIKAVDTLMKAGAHAIKLEGADGNLGLIRHLVQSGVPVMGHLGFMPQSIHMQGAQAPNVLLENAKRLQEAGCFSVLLECVPAPLAESLSAQLAIPILGAESGRGVDGQLVLLHRMLGLLETGTTAAAKTYLKGFDLVQNALSQFHDDVMSERY
jgi:3-methyl-2-oxobutanoate hydroxymethyltransferase